MRMWLISWNVDEWCCIVESVLGVVLGGGCGMMWYDGE